MSQSIIIVYTDLRNAFEFVSSGSKNQHNAYISLDTGTIYWTSNALELEEEVPDNLEFSDSCILVPHKNEFKLGQNLALSFIDQELPYDYNFVASLFRKSSAYRRFKELLQSQGLLEKWFAFEASASDKALLDWRNGNDIQLLYDSLI